MVLVSTAVSTPVDMRAVVAHSPGSPAALRIASGQVKAVIERRYDLDGIPEALVCLATGHAGAKIAIEVDP